MIGRALAGVLVGLLLLAPSTALAAGSTRPAASASQPAAPAAIPRHGYQAKGMTGEVLAFLRPKQLDYALAHLDYDAVGTIAFFSIVADRNGDLVKGTAWTAWNSSKMSTIIERAHAAKTAVALSVSRFAWDATGRAETSALLSCSSCRTRLASQIASAVAARGVDGVNLDVEPIPTGQRANFVALVRAVRAALRARDPLYQLTVASTGHIGNYDVAGITADGAAHAIYIMGYQYRGNWSTTAGSTAPIDSGIYDLRDTLAAYLARAPARKIVLGVPYYGYTFSTVNGSLHAATTGYARSILYDAALATVDRYGRRYDTREQTVWAAYQVRACSTCPLTWRQTYTENQRSLAAKYDLAIANGLRGAGIWALGYEGERPGLYRLLEEKFGAPGAASDAVVVGDRGTVSVAASLRSGGQPSSNKCQ